MAWAAKNDVARTVIKKRRNLLGLETHGFLLIQLMTCMSESEPFFVLRGIEVLSQTIGVASSAGRQAGDATLVSCKMHGRTDHIRSLRGRLMLTASEFANKRGRQITDMYIAVELVSSNQDMLNKLMIRLLCDCFPSQK
ncbi:hypothetical protein QW131_16445 [Roseibium salinum]|nr:hypothetical protein [Roseibium salinum]